MNARVRVAIDFNCAASFLAVEPTRALEGRLGVPFEWLAFPSVARTMPAVKVTGGERSARHFMHRFQYVADELRRYAASRGVEIGETLRSLDTTAASLGLIWIGRRSPSRAGEYAARIFDCIWRENAEPDLDLVRRTLGPAEPEFVEFARGAGGAELNAVRDELSSEGLWTVPGYLVGGEVFIGRQHLPMVEWLATSEDAALSAINRKA